MMFVCLAWQPVAGKHSSSADYPIVPSYRQAFRVPIVLHYHTICAAPWISLPVAFYAFDPIMRQTRYKIKNIHLIQNHKQMTVRIPLALSPS